MTMFSLDQLNALSAADFTAALADIYERSPWVAEAASTKRPFATLAAHVDAELQDGATSEAWEKF